jgi:(p)ppGpp synthase/HD superfamily hydrolase
MKTQNFDKLYTALKYYLIGKGYKDALKALSFAHEYHTGFRKDGKTPEFQHQLEIALHITTLKDLVDEESCICVALLHDVVEDYNVDIKIIKDKFGESRAHSTWCITKKYHGIKKSQEQYMHECANDREASIVKGVDRYNNLGSMVGVFTVEKQKLYLKEAKEFFLPMLKTASKIFTEQNHAYMNIRNSISMQIQLIGTSLPEE